MKFFSYRFVKGRKKKSKEGRKEKKIVLMPRGSGIIGSKEEAPVEADLGSFVLPVVEEAEI